MPNQKNILKKVTLFRGSGKRNLLTNDSVDIWAFPRLVCRCIFRRVGASPNITDTGRGQKTTKFVKQCQTIFFRCVTPCAAKTWAVRPVFGRVVGSWGQQIQEFARRAMKPNARQGHTLRLLDEAREVGRHQHPGPENQDSQHMIGQPRGSFPDFRVGFSMESRTHSSKRTFWELQSFRETKDTVRVYG